MNLLLSGCLAVVAAPIVLSAAPIGETEHFAIHRINDHVYAFVTPDPTLDWVDGNSYTILTDDGVFTVDAHHMQVIAEANIAELKKLTDKPVTYLLNTHWHGDHLMGNPAWVRAYPNMHIITHSKTREILDRRMQKWVDDSRNGKYEEYLDYFGKQLSENKDEEGKPLTEGGRRHTERLMEKLRRYAPDAKRAEAVYPNISFDRELTLYMGGRHIQIRHDFRANTPGDAYVWLPQDSILITGDILVHPIPYCFGSFFQDWIKSFDAMLALKPKIILPGHGEPMTDVTYLQNVRDMFASLVEQTKQGLAKGITSEDSLRTFIDMSKYRTLLAGDDYDRNWAFDNFFLGPAIPRVLKELTEGLDGDDTKAN